MMWGPAVGSTVLLFTHADKNHEQTMVYFSPNCPMIFVRAHTADADGPIWGLIWSSVWANWVLFLFIWWHHFENINEMVAYVSLFYFLNQLKKNIGLWNHPLKSVKCIHSFIFKWSETRLLTYNLGTTWNEQVLLIN